MFVCMFVGPSANVLNLQTKRGKRGRTKEPPKKREREREKEEKETKTPSLSST